MAPLNLKLVPFWCVPRILIWSLGKKGQVKAKANYHHKGRSPHHNIESSPV